MRKREKNGLRAMVQPTVFGFLLLGVLPLLLLFLSLSVALPAPCASTAIAQSVIVLIIDGMRNEEAFDDPTHQYIPHIWKDLRPQGIINTNFWNTGVTFTTAGHCQIVTGVRENLAVQGQNAAQSRAKYPNIFEYYRKAKGVPRDRVWFIAGKGYITDSIDASLHPDYANWGACIESLHRSDSETWASVQQKMDAYHPSLLVINLADVDAQAHTGDYAAYVNAIKGADQIAYKLWQKIQGDAYYKGLTDLIVTTDHGRFSAGYFSGFKDHGGRTHGDRHVPFLAMGPDFKQNTVVNIRGDQIDIPPTLGALLGFQTPYADGRVMAELFKDTSLALGVQTGGQRRISLSACATGLHAVWSKKRGSEWDIYYKRSLDGGTSWTQPIKLLVTGVNKNHFYEAELTSQDDGLVYVTATGYAEVNQGGPTYTWRVFGIRSLDGGSSWGTIQALKDVGVLAIHPRIVSRDQKILIAFSALQPGATSLENRSVQSLFSNDNGDTFTKHPITDAFVGGSISYLSLAASPETFHCIWASERTNSEQWYWNTFYDKASGDPLTWGTDTPVIPDIDRIPWLAYFMNNSIAVNEWGLIKALVTRREGTFPGGRLPAKWATLLKSSQDSGSTFTDEDPFYDPGTYEAWNPRISFVSQNSADFIVVWEQHYDHQCAEVFRRTRLGSIWKDTRAISLLDGKDSAEPDLAVYQDQAFIGWQDYQNGYWQIRVKGIDWLN